MLPHSRQLVLGKPFQLLHHRHQGGTFLGLSSVSPVSENQRMCTKILIQGEYQNIPLGERPYLLYQRLSSNSVSSGID